MEKKYLFLVKTDGFAGAEHLQMEYLKFIDHDKYSVTLGLKNDLFSPYLKKNGLPVSVVDLPLLDDKDRFFKIFFKYYKFFQTIKPACVIFNQYWLRSFSLSEIMAAWIVTKGNAFMIVHDCPPQFAAHKGRRFLGFLPHLGLSWRIYRLFQTLLGYFTKNTISVSKASTEALLKTHHFPPWNVKTVYHGVDIHAYCPSAQNRIKFRQKLNFLPSDTVIISTAMLWPGKRIDRLIEAFATIVGQQGKNIYILIVGTGSESRKLMSIAGSLGEGISPKIRFLGYRDDIADLLQLSDIYVLPSDSEGLSIACLEAMACGLISVTTDCGGVVEIIHNGDNGFLVEKSREGIIDGLNKALNLSPAQKEKMSQNSRRFVEKEFNLERNIHSGLRILGLDK